MFLFVRSIIPNCSARPDTGEAVEEEDVSHSKASK